MDGPLGLFLSIITAVAIVVVAGLLIYDHTTCVHIPYLINECTVSK